MLSSSLSAFNNEGLDGGGGRGGGLEFFNQ